MKRFLKLLCAFFAILLIMAFALNFVINKKIEKTQTEFFKSWNDIYASRINSDVIIMGSSRAYVQYSPAIIDSILNINSYNLSFNGGSIDAQVLKYNTYLRFNKKPKTIIQNIDMFTIELWNGFQIEQFLPYLSDDSVFNQIKRKGKFTLADKYVPCFKYIGYGYLIEDEFFSTRPHATIYKGYLGEDHKTWDGMAFSAIDSLTFNYDTVAYKIFDNYLLSCKQNNIKVIFVYAPIYIDVTKKVKNLHKLYETYNNFSTKYDIPILDYTYDSISFDTKYFYNATHMNKTGAELFSTKLAHDIDSLGLLKR